MLFAKQDELIGLCKESCRDDSVQRNRYELCVCMRERVCVRERETRSNTQRIRKVSILTKEKDSTTYKVGGGCFI